MIENVNLDATNRNQSDVPQDRYPCGHEIEALVKTVGKLLSSEDEGSIDKASHAFVRCFGEPTSDEIEMADAQKPLDNLVKIATYYGKIGQTQAASMLVKGMTHLEAAVIFSGFTDGKKQAR